MQQISVKPENTTIMNCREAELQIIDFLSCRPYAEIPEGLAGHLVSCSSCSKQLLEYRDGFHSLASGRRVAPDPDFYNRLTAKMNGIKELQTLRNKPLARIVHLRAVIATAAASLILGIWLGGKVFNLVETGSDQEGNLSGQQRVAIIQAYAGDLHLNDETNLALENYLIENEKTDTDD